ncbi:MAG: peptidase C39 family protein [Thermoplasmata archaeon]|uniref:Peptidase C39 family protein n=1 Tax=Candidatus Sysuiplasma superficiale TaxID=2823368 RepID=A0A8J7YQE7_9ARCH|nr:peptidase C39 family protein [Candidatus Sysuiplasma superficiale]MBX8643276.1 peptidase C39 family protein [Candidatus Sysuiplasma superficiale]MCL4347319.1 peptidase C39 family protein [Candidatus Thermoplasmatota archaeon]
MRIDVPFYRQTMDFTCGAACILMVLSYHDRQFRMDRDNEMDIWREGTSVIPLGIGRYGLSFPFLKRGYTVSIKSNVTGIEFLERIRKRLDERQMAIFRELYEERRSRAFKMGLMEETVSELSLQEVKDSLFGGNVPLMLTDAAALGDETAPHWIAITGVENDTIHLNNPLAESPSSLPAGDFGRINGFMGEQILVSVGRKAEAVTSYSSQRHP